MPARRCRQFCGLPDSDLRLQGISARRDHCWFFDKTNNERHTAEHIGCRLLTSWTRALPRALMILAAIALPMLPSPMKPTCAGPGVDKALVHRLVSSATHSGALLPQFLLATCLSAPHRALALNMGGGAQSRDEERRECSCHFCPLTHRNAESSSSCQSLSRNRT